VQTDRNLRIVMPTFVVTHFSRSPNASMRWFQWRRRPAGVSLSMELQHRRQDAGATSARCLVRLMQLPLIQHQLEKPCTFELSHYPDSSDASVSRSLDRPVAPSGETLFYKTEDRLAVLRYQFQPRQWSHLREVDSPEAHSSDENIYSIAQGFEL
jgi:hypothetical protein